MTAPPALPSAGPARSGSALVGTLVCLMLAGGCAAAEEATDPGADPTAGGSSSSPSSTPSSSLAPSPSGSPAELPSASARPSRSATSATSEPEPEPVDLEIEIQGDDISPTGDRVPARAGEPVAIRIDSDVPGELHIHSSPEQFLDFAAGTSRHEITIDRPGIVDVELHEPAVTLVQLEVR